MGLIVKVNNKEGLFRDLEEQRLMNQYEYITDYLMDDAFHHAIGETVEIRMNGDCYYCFHFLTEHYIDEDVGIANEDDAKAFHYLSMDVTDR
ncbi:hypothetical protein EPH95_15910 [Salicibibacter halophilus]|uniref:Uncharacterized protein n=1 Tax=Salicibibacter halophilus TaxID=2502791 RepID=A0A514LMJ5_9BACI|nr:hypothetical protein [Salicibibacter halophilus]QDI92491.1 hypothetical protein EPH95_15910 [Salicibibacter halophilus]